MRGTLIKDDASDAEIMAVVSAVKFMGEHVLVAFTRELAFDNNVRVLEAMEKEGIFEVDLQAATQMRSLDAASSSISFQSALPLIDALAGVIDRGNYYSSSYPSCISPSDSVNVSYPLVDSTEDMRVFMRRVCDKSLKNLDCLSHVDQPKSSADPNAAVATKLRHTAMVVCAIGFALDDPALVRIALAADKNCLHRVALNFRSLPWNKLKKLGNECREPSISPFGLGVYMQSTQCMLGLDPALWAGCNETLWNAQWNGQNNKQHDCLGLFGLISEIPHSLTPNFMAAVLQRGSALLSVKPQTNRSGVQNFNYSRSRLWLKEKFLPEIIGGGLSYLLPVVMRSAPALFALDLKTSCTKACSHALPELIELLGDAMEIPRLRSLQVPVELARFIGDWFLPVHPINQVIDTITSATPQQDCDGALVAILKIMSARGILEDINAARLSKEGRLSFAHLCVSYRFKKSLVAMGEMGLDLSILDANGNDPKAYALKAGEIETADLIAAVQTRQQALFVLKQDLDPVKTGNTVRAARSAGDSQVASKLPVTAKPSIGGFRA